MKIHQAICFVFDLIALPCLYFAGLKRVLEEDKYGKTESDLNFPASVVWQGLVSSFKTDMDIFGQWLDLYYLGEAFDL